MDKYDIKKKQSKRIKKKQSKRVGKWQVEHFLWGKKDTINCASYSNVNNKYASQYFDTIMLSSYYNWIDKKHIDRASLCFNQFCKQAKSNW